MAGGPPRIIAHKIPHRIPSLQKVRGSVRQVPNRLLFIVKAQRVSVCVVKVCCLGVALFASSLLLLSLRDGSLFLHARFKPNSHGIASCLGVSRVPSDATRLQSNALIHLSNEDRQHRDPEKYVANGVQ